MGSNPVDTINVDSLKKKLDQWTTYLCYVRTYDRRFFYTIGDIEGVSYIIVLPQA